MRRRMYDEMLAWKGDSAGRTVLLIEGARRVGKSWLAQEFASREYRSHIAIDFNRAGADVRELFETQLNDLDSFFLTLSAIFGVRLYPRESLVVLDEIQLCPRARAALKYLVADGRFDYIETGSLMSIRENVRDIVIPSEERHMSLHPMSFDEFLAALGEEAMGELIRYRCARRRPLGEAAHRRAMGLFRQYAIVGGMPQAVAEFVATRDFERVDRVKRDILDLYRADIAKHAGGAASKVRAIFDEIPSALQAHEKKFRLSSLKRGARTRDYDDALFWLDDAMIVNMCYRATEPNIGLRLAADRAARKCYMADTGLLVSAAFDERGIASGEIYRKILTGRLEFNEGMITENIVAQMLVAAGHKLYFYSNASREDAASRMELDFLIAAGKLERRHNILPIEVKSGKRYTLTSLRKMIAKYGDHLGEAFVVHSGDLRQEEGITYLPLYMANELMQT